MTKFKVTKGNHRKETKVLLSLSNIVNEGVMNHLI